jgi:peptide/nickel transport system substrate-binding protein
MGSGQPLNTHTHHTPMEVVMNTVKNTKRRWLAVPATLMALGLSACGGASGEPAAQPTADGPIDSAVMSLPAPSQSLDPTASVTATDRATWGLTNGTLFRAEFDGTIVPSLAESVEYNADYTEATVKLVSDAKFSDGSPLTAKDVEATFNRQKAVESSTLAATMNRVSSITAQEDGSVKFVFAGPFPSFEDYFAQGSTGIFPAAGMASPEEFFKNPVTSGPYKIAEAWSSNQLVLETNENYFGPKPIIEDLTLTIVEDANSAISQLQSGQIDYAGDLPPNFLGQLEGSPNVTVEGIQAYGFYDLRMNNTSGPLADVNMRKAINAALDREAIVTSIWGDKNEPLQGFWPQSMEGFDPDKETGRDLDAAKEFLGQTANCQSGCSVRMMYSDQDFPFAGQLALMVQSQLKEAGIDVQLEKLDAATLIDRLFAGDYDMVPGAMAAPSNVPDPLLTNALLSTGHLKAEFTGYKSAQMDELIAKVNANTGEARTEAINGISDLFTEDQPYAVLAPWVRGAASTLPAGTLSLQGTAVVVGTQK